MISEVQHRKDLLARDGRIQFEELFDGFATFQEVDQALDRDARAAEAGRATHTLGVDPDRLVEPLFLFDCHTSTLGQFPG